MKKVVYRIISVLLTAVLTPVCFAVRANAEDSLFAYFNVGITKYKAVSSVKIESASIGVYSDLYGSPDFTFDRASGFTISAINGQTALSADGETLCAFEPMFIKGADGLTTIGGTPYRGFIKPVRSGSGITVVNAVGVEQYLYGVVPAEMPASWHSEALKAQAVAARSYLFAEIEVNRHAADVYDVCDTIHCQYYPGIMKEHERTTDAVNQTAGVIAYYDGKPANSVFSASSGGYTENSENIWGTAIPYLRGVKEPAENEFLEWRRSYTFEQLDSALAANGVNIGKVTSVTAEYFPSGRVSKLIFSGTSGSKAYEGDAVRSFSSRLDGSLPSIMFKINGYCWSQGGVWDSGAAVSSGSDNIYVAGAGQMAVKSSSEIYAEASTGAASRLSGVFSALGRDGLVSYPLSSVGAQADPSGNNSFTITSGSITLEGRGNGHGVGMSQYGAKGMADAGYDFVQILKHYFTGIDIY